MNIKPNFFRRAYVLLSLSYNRKRGQAADISYQHRYAGGLDGLRRSLYEQVHTAYFLEIMMTAEGEEHDRAECVYIQLLHGLDECSDEDE